MKRQTGTKAGLTQTPPGKFYPGGELSLVHSAEVVLAKSDVFSSIDRGEDVYSQAHSPTDNSRLKIGQEEPSDHDDLDDELRNRSTQKSEQSPDSSTKSAVRLFFEDEFHYEHEDERNDQYSEGRNEKGADDDTGNSGPFSPFAASIFLHEYTVGDHVRNDQ